MREILGLLDALEDTVDNGRSEPLTRHVRVDRVELHAIVAEIRRAVPDEIEQARWIAREREEMLAEARREAERILEQARRESARLLAAEEVTKRAQQQATEILAKARVPEREIRLRAEDYADEFLQSLERYFERFAAAVRRGRVRPPADRAPRPDRVLGAR